MGSGWSLGASPGQGRGTGNLSSPCSLASDAQLGCAWTVWREEGPMGEGLVLVTRCGGRVHRCSPRQVSVRQGWGLHLGMGLPGSTCIRLWG